ncbi:uncharacterized protein PHALS_13559 [Plasmopara halstedii]|uniref:Uncharacterized protein n=1 Tax=Plasmopara halstedii TaxID=4781 RepID=A0A0P1APF7_PLAHL|nr:uncharacterized protein PHALS_13559 [Plasmopara halstedii]CEG43359.1 hypothetical protein PHALS_13559 [Plasmopara halstedii]|eukprot:XP_024579728.1 hypothetical protein PHALS_13559 [Plasmopara halstedii]
MVLKANKRPAELEKGTREKFERAYKKNEFYTKIMEGRGDTTIFTVKDGLIFRISTSSAHRHRANRQRCQDVVLVEEHA